jgi:hypothetical protein
MKSLGLSRYALAFGAASVFLAGCGGSQPPIGAPGAMPQSRAAATGSNRSRSWMLPEHPNKAGAQFLYVAGAGHSYVLSYPKGRLIGTIDSGAASTCADKSGNAFLTLDTSVTEYHNGGTTPTKTLEVGGTTVGCASDATTGNLAVTFESSNGNVAIFPDASGSPTVYHDNINALYCGYDSDGNLFVDGLTASAHFVLTELPKGGSTFKTITISPQITKLPGQVQWDGQYITVEGLFGGVKSTTIYRLQVSGSSANVVGTTSLQGSGHAAALSWIKGSRVLVPFSTRSGKGSPNVVGVWNYPEGGKRIKLLKGFPNYPSLSGVSVTRTQ